MEWFRRGLSGEALWLRKSLSVPSWRTSAMPKSRLRIVRYVAHLGSA